MSVCGKYFEDRPAGGRTVGGLEEVVVGMKDCLWRVLVPLCSGGPGTEEALLDLARAFWRAAGSGVELDNLKAAVIGGAGEIFGRLQHFGGAVPGGEKSAAVRIAALAGSVIRAGSFAEVFEALADSVLGLVRERPSDAGPKGPGRGGQHR